MFINYIFYIKIEILQDFTTPSLRGCVCINKDRNYIFEDNKNKIEKTIKVCGAILERWFSILFRNMYLFTIKVTSN